VGALLTRAVERLDGDAAGRLGRITVEILGPVLRSEPVTVVAGVERPGRKIALREATLAQAGPDGRPRDVARARAWWVRERDTAAAVHRPGPVLRLPEPTAPSLFEASVPSSWRTGFIGSMQWRVVTPIGPGDTPAVAWSRMGVDLVEGEAISDAQRAVATADTANGIGARLDTRDWSFVNTELTVHLFDRPDAEWIGVEAESAIGPHGIGTGSALLHGERGPFGRVTQCLLVEPVS